MNTVFNSGKYWIETYGCQMNKAESESISFQLKEMGMASATNPEHADIVILNTCSVRKTAEDRVWGRIGHYRSMKSRNRQLKVAVIGCMAERLREELKEDGVDLVIGNFEKHKIKEILAHAYNPESTPGADKKIIHSEYNNYRFFDIHSAKDFKAFLPIMHGCNNFCSYCIVPYVRGREVSREPAGIIKEIRILADRGVKEVTLLGQNVNSYYFDSGGKPTGFPELLEMIAGEIAGTKGSIEWVRFLTSHPKDLSDRLIGVLQEYDLFCNHIHLPVQHGSDRILELMRRKYTREQYLELTGKLKQAIPGISLTSDILIGFPSETEEDYRQTLDLIKQAQFSDAFTYKYNPREGTKAFDMEDTVPDELKLERLAEIIELQRGIGVKIKRSRTGERVKVLVERISKKNDKELLGRTERDDMVVFPGTRDMIGGFRHIKIYELNGNTFWGKEE